MEKIIPFSLLPLNSSPCHCHCRCHSPFITQTLPTTNRFKKNSNTLSCSYSYSYSYRSPSSSMDSPPQGYRRNVGICLVNASKKVYYLYLSLSVLYMGFYMYVLNWLASFSFLFFLFFWVVADLFSFKVGYTQCLANAPGNFFFLFWFNIEVL